MIELTVFSRSHKHVNRWHVSHYLGVRGHTKLLQRVEFFSMLKAGSARPDIAMWLVFAILQERGPHNSRRLEEKGLPRSQNTELDYPPARWLQAPEDEARHMIVAFLPDALSIPVRFCETFC
jgi:hypothetical protein